MPRGKQTSSEDKAKVISKKIENPDLSLRDIERETGVNYVTTKEILDKDLWNVLTSSNKLVKLVDTNIEIMNDGKEIIKRIVQDIKNNRDGGIKINGMQDVKSLSSIIEDAFKQNQLLTWGKTEDVKLDIDFSQATLEDLTKIINQSIK